MPRYAIPDGRNATQAEIHAAQKVRGAERAALAGMRDLADFDVLCKLSEALCAADREFRRVQRRAARDHRRRFQIRRRK